MRDTIKKHADFIMTDENPTARSIYFIVRAKPAKYPDDPRCGFTATKKTFKLAVHRNRAKRLLREWARQKEKLMLNNYDYVFIARHAILDASRDEGMTAMAKALNYIKKQDA